MMDAGVLSVCELMNTAEAGAMPVEKLVRLDEAYFEERTVGYARYFTARGVNEQVDLMVRTWRLPEARAGRYAVLQSSENDGQYRIVQVQQVLNEDGLKCTDLSLSRLAEFYELEEVNDECAADAYMHP